MIRIVLFLIAVLGALFYLDRSNAAAGAPPFEIYVSASAKPGGGGDGSRGRPFATLEEARDALRSLRKAGKLPPASGGVVVRIAAGVYRREGAFRLGAEDSGGGEAAPVIYRAEEGARVVLTNGRALKLSDFKLVSDEPTLARIPANLRGRIVELDLRAAGVVHRGPYKDVFSDNGGIVNLYASGRRMPLARFPNEGYMTMKKVVDTAGGLQDSNWRDPANAVKPPDPNRGGTFEYRDEYAAKHEQWSRLAERGVWLKGYWRVMWQNEAVRVRGVDADKKTVTLARPIPGGIGNKYTRPFGNGREMYWAMNLLEEVDSPGEWCVDFVSQKLYFYPPDGVSDILIADSDEPVVRTDGTSNVTLRGLTIEGTLGDGVVVRGGEDVKIAGCEIRNVTKYGVRIEGGLRHEVLSSDLHDLGAGGVWLSGGDEKASPRIPAGHRVVNNHIHHFAQVELIYAPAVNSGFTGGGGGGHHPAVGMYVAHNLIHDTPHGGVLFGSWDSVFEYNEVFRYCTVSNDLGAFYSYDLYERMGNITFRYNFIHSTDDGDGIYFDHDHREMKIFGNVALLNSRGKRGTAFLLKIGSQAKNPQTTDVRNNIAINSNFGFVFVSSGRDKNENNVSVNVKTPFVYRLVRDGRETPSTAADLASGPNATYDADPGFVDLGRFDLCLRKDSKVFRDLPGFEPIPFEKIGLFTDEFRKRLPTDDEVDRFDRAPRRALPGYDILDRGN